MTQRTHSPPTLRDAMVPFPHSVDVEAPIAEARQFMREHHVRHLPVTSDGELAGLLSDRDIKLMLGPDFDYPREDELTVRDVYVEDPYIIDVRTPFDEVLMSLADRHIGSALVTEHGKLVGILTPADACRTFAQYLRGAISDQGGVVA